MESSNLRVELGCATRLAEEGQSAQVVKLLNLLLDHTETNIDPLTQLAQCLAKLGRFDEARKALKKLAEKQPENVEAFFLLGHVLCESGQTDLAIDSFYRCLELNPSNIEAIKRLSHLHRSRDELGKMFQLLEKACAHIPNNTEILHELAWAVFYLSGNTDKGANLFQQSLTLGNKSPNSSSVALRSLSYASNQRFHSIYQLHRQWAEQQADPLGQEADFTSHDFNANRPIRIGFLSADFVPHPVGRYTLALCQHLDSKKFQLYIYSNRKDSGLKAQFLKLASWRNVFGIEDNEVIEIMHTDKIDILIDLSGHTESSRPFLLAKRPAPTIAAVFAYPNTTGMKAVDYRISDPHSDPIGLTETLWTEKLERMPDSAWLYLPMLDFNITSPDEIVNLNTDPLLEIQPYEPQIPSCTGAPFTFGCLNNPLKISRACVRLWGQVLKKLPDSRIILFQLNDNHGELLRDQFYECGANQKQIDIRPKGDAVYYLKLHYEIDLMLDPFPYNGGISTCDSFWMGVPVLCMNGKSYVSRQGVMQNTCLKLEAFIANDHEEFIQKALQISRNQDLLKQLRSNLREMLKRSPLMDYNRYANQFGDMLQRWWAKRCDVEKSIA